jgi:DNA-binding FadR family transcriptional regulator
MLNRVTLVSVARATADQLREEILNSTRSDEWLLGSETELMATLAVSRATLRQALRLLEQEQLVVTRRGPGGGLFARRPTADGVSHMASIYLRSASTSFGDLIRTLGLLSAHCAEEAAGNPDLARRQALVGYYTGELAGVDIDLISGHQFVRAAGGFFRAVADLGGSSTMRLYVKVLIDLARPAAGEHLYNTERIRGTVERHTEIARSIAAGRGREAAERMNTHIEQVLTWTDERMPMNAMYARRRDSNLG